MISPRFGTSSPAVSNFFRRIANEDSAIRELLAADQLHSVAVDRKLTTCSK